MTYKELKQMGDENLRLTKSKVFNYNMDTGEISNDVNWVDVENSFYLWKDGDFWYEYSKNYKIVIFYSNYSDYCEYHLLNIIIN
jgi:hypothetical protein